MDLHDIEKFYVYAPDDTYLGCFRVFRNPNDNHIRKTEFYGERICDEMIDRLNEGDLYYSNTKMSLSSVRRLHKENNQKLKDSIEMILDAWAKMDKSSSSLS